MPLTRNLSGYLNIKVQPHRLWNKKMKYYTNVKGRLQEKSKEEIMQEAEVLEKSIAATFENILSTIKVDVF